MQGFEEHMPEVCSLEEKQGRTSAVAGLWIVSTYHSRKPDSSPVHGLTDRSKSIATHAFISNAMVRLGKLESRVYLSLFGHAIASGISTKSSTEAQSQQDLANQSAPNKSAKRATDKSESHSRTVRCTPQEKHNDGAHTDQKAGSMTRGYRRRFPGRQADQIAV